MREKELRLALVCYGGISLAVYMHGITKEIWRLARASRDYHSSAPRQAVSASPYERLLATISDECGIQLRVLVDILAGASAGGINAIFLGQAISSGRSLDPLTELWLETADVDVLLDHDVSRVSRIAKSAAVPIAWALSSRGNRAVEKTVEEGHRDEVRGKLANFVRSKWFDPPFSGAGFTNLLLNALDAMANAPAGAPLLPDYQPLDLFVTVTDFHGHEERLRLNSPVEAVETEHRLILSFRDRGGSDRRIAEAPELAFAARATASFPGAFPPFSVGELDRVLEARKQRWPGRAAFLERALPGNGEHAVLIDGSVLANAPFRPAIDALQSRPARREIDRRFVYIDPKPAARSIRLTPTGEAERPGFLATVLAALSDIPREQPIRDNLEAIDSRSERVRRLRDIVEAMRPDVEGAIERGMGKTFLLGRPTPKRMAEWRSRAAALAAQEAGYAHAAYAQLRSLSVAEETAASIYRLSGGGRERRDRIRKALLNRMGHGGRLPREEALDLSYRTRRLRVVARHLRRIEDETAAQRPEVEQARDAIHALIGRCRAPVEADRKLAPPVFLEAEERVDEALEAFAAMLDLPGRDAEADALICTMLAPFPKAEQRALTLSYLGFPFYDVATLPLLQGEGLDEFEPIKVDRIAPEDATAIRSGGASATLKGIQFNSFGAFFSRAYRENDYLWGRLHGADRLIAIVVSTLPEGVRLPDERVAQLKREAFRAILAEERTRLGAIGPLFEALEKEIG